MEYQFFGVNNNEEGQVTDGGTLKLNEKNIKEIIDNDPSRYENMMQKLYKHFAHQNAQNNLASGEMSEEEAFENLLTDGKNLPNFPNIRSHTSSPDFALIQLVLLIFTFVVALCWAFCCRKSNTVQNQNGRLRRNGVTTMSYDEKLDLPPSYSKVNLFASPSLNGVINKNGENSQSSDGAFVLSINDALNPPPTYERAIEYFSVMHPTSAQIGSVSSHRASRQEHVVNLVLVRNQNTTDIVNASSQHQIGENSDVILLATSNPDEIVNLGRKVSNWSLPNRKDSTASSTGNARKRSVKSLGDPSVTIGMDRNQSESASGRNETNAEDSERLRKITLFDIVKSNLRLNSDIPKVTMKTLRE